MLRKLVGHLFLLSDRSNQSISSGAVSCSPIGPGLGEVKMGVWLTGKLGRAWDGAWVVYGVGVWVSAWHGGGVVVMMWWGWDKCM